MDWLIAMGKAELCRIPGLFVRLLPFPPTQGHVRIERERAYQYRKENHESVPHCIKIFIRLQYFH